VAESSAAPAAQPRTAGGGAGGAAADPVFAAFCEAGLWAGLGRMPLDTLVTAGITGPDAVTAARLQSLPQVGAKRADRLLSAWIGAGPAYDVVGLLLTAGLPARLAARAVDQLGEIAVDRLRADPWLLLDLTEVRLAQADRFARSVLPGVGVDDVRRGRAVVVEALRRAARDGHTALSITQIGDALVEAGVPDPGAAVAGACAERGVIACTIDSGAALALERYAAAEEAVAEGIGLLIDGAKPFTAAGAPEVEVAVEEAADEDAADRTVVDVAAADDELDATQRRAVHAAMELGVSVLTGGPGTGKSRTVAAVVRLAQERGKQVALAAPTGRAARRLAEFTDAPTSTLHRMLGAQGAGGQHRGTVFTRGPDWPLDADLVVVDEVSMLDVELAAALVEACAEGTHLMLVGDAAQLPSIGPGRVLADIIDAGAVPVTELTTLYR
jgi:exodeoxyribonuclease V alpha subunit